MRGLIRNDDGPRLQSRGDAFVTLARSIARLRACGLSSKKSSYLINLAEHFLDGSLDIARWGERDDEQFIEELTKVKGIGRWTAEMFLIFFVIRPNVLPLDDIGLQRAMGLHYNSGRPLSKLKMRQIATAGSRGAPSPPGACGAASIQFRWNTSWWSVRREG